MPVDPAATSSKTSTSGKVIVQIFVSKIGMVEGAIVVQSSGYPKPDEAGLKAVLHQKLTPTTQGGQPPWVDLMKVGGAARLSVKQVGLMLS